MCLRLMAKGIAKMIPMFKSEKEYKSAIIAMCRKYESKWKHAYNEWKDKIFQEKDYM